MTSTLSATPTVMSDMPLTLRFTKQNPKTIAYDSEQDPDADVFDPIVREVDELERDLDRQRHQQQPERLEVERAQALEAPLRRHDDDQGERDRRHEEDHTHHRTDAGVGATGILRLMYELRSSSEGRVVRVDVDEGQMVAEEDEIATLDTESGRVVVLTDVPGVVRELYVEAGSPVTPGTLVALIDES